MRNVAPGRTQRHCLVHRPCTLILLVTLVGGGALFLGIHLLESDLLRPCGLRFGGSWKRRRSGRPGVGPACRCPGSPTGGIGYCGCLASAARYLASTSASAPAPGGGSRVLGLLGLFGLLGCRGLCSRRVLGGLCRFHGRRCCRCQRSGRGRSGCGRCRGLLPATRDLRSRLFLLRGLLHEAIFRGESPEEDLTFDAPAQRLWRLQEVNFAAIGVVKANSGARHTMHQGPRLGQLFHLLAHR
mmetsp:Transcript_5632/g.13145  ORF Transcript_5632/g.13145 Transcript_5632/m.13145 type:complete len:242 (+) Transcript_5632:148-873(+)